MPSSFAAQQQGSRNPHQNPVRSHKGGYLRCPFNISPSYAELAEMRVREDLACGGSRTAVADRDGMMASLSTGPQVNGDGIDGDFGSRPWCRAGVGASRLSGKEKRIQQEQAELIYGRGALASDDGIGEATGTVSVGSGRSRENMFAVDARDQAALQQVVPRAVREKVKRRKFENLKKECLPPDHYHRHDCAPMPTNRAAGSEVREEDDVGLDSEDHTKAPLHKRTLLSPAAARTPRNDTSRLSHSAGSEAHPSGSSNGASAGAEQSPRSGPSGASVQRAPLQAPTPAPALTTPRCLKNRMQMLDDLRVSALVGKRRRR
ncbi:hypothetical protein Q4I32_005929 [Leishmania shawi]|uniref:Uncharacterized protein n=1 Tax=Leishmania shawi TaxID=5680 RepID=A0AAW3BFC5_9TRYP